MSDPKICTNCGLYLERQDVGTFGALVVEHAQIWWKGCDVRLSPRKRDIFCALVQASGRPVSYEALINVTEAPNANTIAVHVSQMRAKFGGDGDRIIRSIRGQGLYIDFDYCRSMAEVV